MQRGAGGEDGPGGRDGSDARTGIGTTVASWLFAVALLIVSAGLVTWAIHGGIRIASAIEAEVRKERARSEAPVILVRPEERDGMDAVPEPPPPPPPPGGPPSWRERPVPWYPDEAIAGGIEEGRVVVACAVEADGRLTLCEIASETPEGYGFGREALRATRGARMQPSEANGQPVETRVSFTIAFRLQ